MKFFCVMAAKDKKVFRLREIITLVELVAGRSMVKKTYLSDSVHIFQLVFVWPS